MEKKFPLQSFSYSLASFIFLSLVFVFIINTLLLLVHYRISAISLIVSPFVTLALLCKWYPETKKYLFLLIFSFIGIILFGLVFSLKFYDFSFDGLIYHQPLFIWLKNGWNPVYNPYPQLSWLTSYPRGFETIIASFYSLTNNLQIGKIINLLASLSVFFLTLSFALDFHKTIYAVIIAMVITIFNPVILLQLPTYYLDNFLTNAIIFLILNIFIYIKKKEENSKIYLINIFLISLLIPSLKFTGFPLLFFILLSFFLIIIIEKRGIKTFFFYFLAIGVIDIALLGYTPYINNIIQHHNIFYPLLENSSLGHDLDSQFTCIIKDLPSSIQNNSILLFFVSLLHKPVSNCSMEASYIIPLIDNHSFQFGKLSYDTRIGGFGTFFNLSFFMILPYLIFIIIMNFKNKKRLFYIASIFATFILMTFTLRYSWWMRYVGHTWFFTLLIFFFPSLINKRIHNIFTILIIAFISFQTLGIIKAKFPIWLKESNLIEEQKRGIPYNKKNKSVSILYPYRQERAITQESDNINDYPYFNTVIEEWLKQKNYRTIKIIKEEPKDKENYKELQLLLPQKIKLFIPKK